MQSPQLMPMTPAFGPMNGSSMPFATQTSSYPNPQSYPSNGPSYGGGNYSQLPVRQPDNPDNFMRNPYGTMLRPNLNLGIVQAENAPPTSALPHTITIPFENVRIISSQVHPIHQPETYTPIAPTQKYSTQMSARIRYLGPPVRNDMIQPMEQAQVPQTTVISVGPSSTQPIVAASAAMIDSPKEMQYLMPGTKVLAEYYLDRKWYPATIKHYDNDKGQYAIDWDDKGLQDLHKLPSQLVKRGGCTIS